VKATGSAVTSITTPSFAIGNFSNMALVMASEVESSSVAVSSVRLLAILILWERYGLERRPLLTVRKRSL
jgi:hypothetical protein